MDIFVSLKHWIPYKLEKLYMLVVTTKTLKNVNKSKVDSFSPIPSHCHACIPVTYVITGDPVHRSITLKGNQEPVCPGSFHVP